MTEAIVFDIETYRPDWRVVTTRREDFDPAKNFVITTGVFDGKEISIFPVIEDLNDESRPVEFLLEKFKEFEGSTFVGYNILHFDIPYIVYKSNVIGKDIDMTQFKLLDLYWIVPYWLHSVPSGRTFFEKTAYLGNLWRFSNVVKYILETEANPFSNFEVLELWEEERFDDIEKHLELDLVHTYSFLKSSVVQETLDYLKKQKFNKSRCGDNCPFRQPLQKTQNKVNYYCTLLQEPVQDEKKMSAIDVVTYPLPGWDVSWIPLCLE